HRSGLLRGLVLTVAAATSSAGLTVARGGAVLHDRVVVNDDATAGADLARLAERLEQSEPELLASHLNQAERGHLCDLVLGAVTAEALDQTTQHEVAVGLEHHVNEVDDDDAADVAQAQLADDLLGRFEVVL